MTSPIVAFMTQVATDWIAEPPPTRPTITYHEVANKRSLEGTSGDRGFLFELPIRLEPIAELGAAMTEVEWRVIARLRLSQGSRSVRELADAVATESNLLLRRVETRSVWPSGVIEVITEATEPERDGEKGDAIVIFNFRVLCAETD